MCTGGNFIRLIRSHIVPIVVIVFLAVIEIFLFNLPFWQTLNTTPTEANITGIGTGLQVQKDGTAKVTDSDEAWRSIASDEPIDYLYVEPSAGESADQSLSWTIFTKKSTDSNWYAATATVGYSTISHISRYSHVGGGATEVRFQYKVTDGDVIPLSDITVNPVIPFNIDIVRLGLEIVIAAIIILFRPGSFLYRKRFGSNVLFDRVGIAIAAMVQIGFLFCAWLVAGGLQAPSGQSEMANGSMVDFDQYAHLANALLQGHVYLDLPVNSDLAQMNNPYDYALRTQIAQTTTDNTPIYFDVAFKDGKYYCYFGVLPALVLFAPYRLITGNNLNVGIAIIILVLLVMIAGIVALLQVARWLVSRGVRVSTGSVLLAVSVLSFSLPLSYTIQHMLFYQIPQTLGLACVFIALACWFKSKLTNLNKGWLVAGSFFMALTLGCRPQLILAAVLALPIFGEDIADLWRHGREDRKGLINEIGTWTCALLPFLVVFIPLLAYNHARFGSPFDFGANYNLTGYDMTHHDLPWTQLVPLIFLYFFQPPYLTLSFPFSITTQQQMGIWTPMQPSYGGYFTLIAPFTVIVLLLWNWRHELRQKKLVPLFLGTIAYLIVVFSFDVHIVGYDVRYILDFGWAIMLLFALCFIVISELQDSVSTVPVGGEYTYTLASFRLTKIIIGIVVTAIVITWIYTFLHIVAQTSTPLGSRLWWQVYSWFLFV